MAKAVEQEIKHCQNGCVDRMAATRGRRRGPMSALPAAIDSSSLLLKVNQKQRSWYISMCTHFEAFIRSRSVYEHAGHSLPHKYMHAHTHTHVH